MYYNNYYKILRERVTTAVSYNHNHTVHYYTYLHLLYAADVVAVQLSCVFHIVQAPLYTRQYSTQGPTDHIDVHNLST